MKIQHYSLCGLLATLLFTQVVLSGCGDSTTIDEGYPTYNGGDGGNDGEPGNPGTPPPVDDIAGLAGEWSGSWQFGTMSEPIDFVIASEGGITSDPFDFLGGTTYLLGGIDAINDDATVTGVLIFADSPTADEMDGYFHFESVQLSGADQLRGRCVIEGGGFEAMLDVRRVPGGSG